MENKLVICDHAKICTNWNIKCPHASDHIKNIDCSKNYCKYKYVRTEVECKTLNETVNG